MSSSLALFAERILGRELPDDLLDRFRTISFALAGIMGLPVCAFFAAFYTYLDIKPAQYVMAGSVPIVAAVIGYYRSGGRLLVAINLLLAVYFVITMYLVYNLGGVISPATSWTLVLPYIALTCSMPRSTAFWFAASAVVLYWYYHLESAGYALPNAFGSDRPLLYMVAQLLLSVVLLSFLFIIERSRGQTWRALQETNRTLAEARDGAYAAAHAKARFLANMSHEIRTPLNGVLGIAELIEHTALSPAQARFIKTLRHSGEHLMSVINDVLDFSKLEAHKLTLEQVAFSPRELVERLVEALHVEAVGKGLELSAEFAPDAPDRVLGDEARVRQILFNLVANALKFTLRGGVTISVRLTDETAASQKLLEFEIADTGIGIETEQIPQLFTAFAQADGSTTRLFGGTGLGLAICHELVSLMAGSLEVESAVGVGSRFRCRLPLPIAERSGAAHLPPASATTCVAGRPKVLLVEDNLVNREIGTAMLEQLGCVVSVATNGAEGVLCWQEGDFSVIFMDCQMPVMDGYTATHTIRRAELTSRRPRVPIIALTANAFREDRTESLAAGMDGFLAKPYTLAQLLNAFREHGLAQDSAA